MRDIGPDAVWIQQEPTDPLMLETLLAASGLRGVTVVGAVCENRFERTPAHVRLAGRVLWRRLDGLAATATASLEGIRAIGLPERTRSATLVAGALEPPGAIVPLELPLEGCSFVAGFAGRIVEEKGWRTLVEAVARLPATVGVAFAGSGDEDDLLHEKIAALLPGRAVHLGLLSRTELFRFYAAVDCLVLPSLTRPQWMEQFGGVLADGMAAGLPLVGSSSGAIPEVVGPAGVIFPEGDADALAATLRELSEQPARRKELGDAALDRFRSEFSIDAYAGKLARLLRLGEPPPG